MNVTLITDIQGPALTDQEKNWLNHPFLGGIILFTRHFESYEQLKNLVAEITAINPKLVITVDHEGGRVQRFREGFTKVPAMGALGKLYEQDKDTALKASKACAVVLASELLNIGIHLTYAPVLDVNYGRNTVIGDRGFSGDKNVIHELAASFMLGLKEMNFATVAKHFPGHGWVDLDSHVACPIDSRTLEEIEQQDMVVFKELMADIDWMMPAHIVYEKVDSETAGFSKVWLQDILRGQLNFNGPIVSDDLSMAGAAIKGNYAQRAQAAMEAGCNIMLACNSSEASSEILDGLESMAKADSAIQSMSLEQYQPKAIDNVLNTPEYLNALALINKIA